MGGRSEPYLDVRNDRTAWTVGAGVDAIQRVAERRADLTDVVASLSRRLAGIKEASEWTSNDDEHDPEGVTIAFERAQVAGLLEMARTELGELDLAEARIRAGVYGTCERCGQPVGDGRLEVLPAATRCVTCADRRR